MTQQEYNQRLFELTHAYKQARRGGDPRRVATALAAVSGHCQSRQHRSLGHARAACR